MAIYSVKKTVCVILLVGLAGAIAAQSASFVETYAEAPAIGGAETLYLLGVAIGRLEPDDPFTEANVTRAAIRGTEEYVERELTLHEFAFLVAEYFVVRPSMMGRLFPSPRYALRDLRSERILLYDADALARVPGDVALRTIRRALEWEAQK
jgi:hypothetical protein